VASSNTAACSAEIRTNIEKASPAILKDCQIETLIRINASHHLRELLSIPVIAVC
jgi:hypothetical protein